MTNRRKPRGIGNREVTRNKGVPMRTCVVCRKCFPKRELLRYVRARADVADRAFVPDPEQVMPGRGWYVCREGTCGERLEAARNKRKKCLIRG